MENRGAVRRIPWQALLWIVYPLAILFGLRVTEPRYVAAVLIGVLILRRWRNAAAFLSGMRIVDRLILAGLAALAATVVLTNSELLLRLYPAAVNVGMLVLFGLSLIRPPSMVERFARLAEPDLPEAAIVYTRRVTVVWCAFFVGNGGAAAYTALLASRETWAWYNGFLAYLLMGVLFAGEWAFRHLFVTGNRR